MPLHRHTNSRRTLARAGFSLMELMIVVVITGILSAVAIPSFTSYILRARTTEATQFLGVIKMRQESYRAEFGSYLSSGPVDPELIEFAPGGKTMMKNSVAVTFPAPTPEKPWWGQLGASPDGPVRFGYGWAAGGPADITSGMKDTYGLTANTLDNYFVAQAISDLDGDGTACVFEVTSFTRNVWVGGEGGTALPAGYE